MRLPAVPLPRLLAAVAVLLALWLALLPPAGLPPEAARAAALGVLAIGFWATGVVPEHVTAIGFFLFAMLFAVAPADVIFSGFASAALWLVFGGLVIGVAVRRTGLGERLARLLAMRLGRSYIGLIAGVTAIAMLLGFLMPSSMGRVVLLMPIAVALAGRFGLEPGSPGRTGVVMAAAFGCHVPTFAVLPANVPNMVMLGAAETLYGVSLTYGEYLLLHFPVLGLLKSMVVVWLIVFLFPDRLRPADMAEAAPVRPMSRDEGRLALVLALALGLWVSDFLHHISPAWIGLAAALVCLVPGMGLVPAKAFNEQINYGSLFYVAGILGLGAMAAHSGLGDMAAHGLLALLPLAPGEAAQNFAGLAGVATLIGLVTTLPGVPAVLTPLASDMAAATGLPLKTVLMTQVLGFSTIMLPYQSAPLVVATQLGGESLASTMKVVVPLFLITVIVLLPLDFVWWRLLGWI